MPDTLRTGDLVTLIRKLRGVTSSSAIIATVRGMPEAERRVYDINGFLSKSDHDGIFRIERTVISGLNDAATLVLLRTHKGKCRTDWLVPACIFNRYVEDWLEELPVGANYEL